MRCKLPTSNEERPTSNLARCDVFELPTSNEERPTSNLDRCDVEGTSNVERGTSNFQLARCDVDGTSNVERGTSNLARCDVFEYRTDERVRRKGSMLEVFCSTFDVQKVRRSKGWKFKRSFFKNRI